MSVTLDQVAALLDKLEVKYNKNAERKALEVPFSLQRYRDADGADSILVVLSVPPDGGSVRAFVPTLYTLPEGPKALPVFRALQLASRQSSFVAYSVDAEDDTIDAIGRIPIANARLTQDQLKMFLEDFPEVIDFFHPMIQGAIETGEIVEPDPEEAAVDAILAEINGLPAEDLIQLREAMEKAVTEEAASTDEQL